MPQRGQTEDRREVSGGKPGDAVVNRLIQVVGKDSTWIDRVGSTCDALSCAR
jgi:hypothetical protein